MTDAETSRRPRRRHSETRGPERHPELRHPETENGAARRSPGMRAARRAARQVMELTGHEPENVVSVSRDGDGWEVGVEVVELHRIPDTTDVMAVYDVILDDHGGLVSCRRGPRYHRGRTQLD